MMDESLGQPVFTCQAEENAEKSESFIEEILIETRPPHKLTKSNEEQSTTVVILLSLIAVSGALLILVTASLITLCVVHGWNKKKQPVRHLEKQIEKGHKKKENIYESLPTAVVHGKGS